MVKLCYTEAFSFNPSAGITSAQVMRANSCFDPNQTGAGTQPPGFDQWGNFYNKYVVMKSTCVLTILPHPGSETPGSPFEAQCMVVLQSRRDSSTPTFANMLASTDHANTRHKVINGSVGPGVVKLSANFNMRRDLGHGPQHPNEGHTGNALIGSNPDEVWHYGITVGNPITPGSNPLTLHIVVRICFIVKFIERKLDIYDV